MRPAIVPAVLTILLGFALAARAAEPETGRITAYTAWSPSAFFVAVRAEDPMIVGDQVEPLGQPWLDDAIAIYLDLNPNDGDALNEHCLRVIVSAAGGATVQRGKDGVWQDDPAWFQPGRYGTIRYGVQVNGKLNDNAEADKDYMVEVGLAWPLLGVQPPVRRAGEMAPTVGFALASYAQGDTQSVSCWPSNLEEADLNHPARWGRLQFTQNMQPVTTREPYASATLMHGSPMVDGKMQGPEWMTAGICAFARKPGLTVTPVGAAPKAVSLVAAWYTLDPDGAAPAHQPLEPIPSGMGPDAPLYHQQQLLEIRKAGLDALAVLLPVEADTRERTRARLAALVRALEAYDRANSATFYTQTPLLLPIIDVRPGADPALAQAMLDEFYLITPPQFRLMLADADGTWRYPVLGVASAPRAAAYPSLNALGAHLRARSGRPIGWLLDTAWPEAQDVDGVLARCNWSPVDGVQLGNGPLRTALIAPGVDAGRERYVPRREGQYYENGWMKLATADPDCIFIRSWNDFADGTEIAPSRQFGTRYRDITRLKTIELVSRRKYGLRLLQHNLPAILACGQQYPVDVMLKNCGMEMMASRAGYRVEYRLLRGEREMAKGLATDQIALLELSAARLRFALSTMQDKRKALPPGEYTLHLDFRRNKVPQITAPLLTQTVWTLTLPVTLGEGSDVAQVARYDIPERGAVIGTLPVTVRLRYPEKVERAAPPAFRLSWMGLDGAPYAGASPLTTKGKPAPGAMVDYTGTMPPAPLQPGWYQARIEMARPDAAPVLLRAAMVRIGEAEPRAQFLSIAMPARADGDTVEVPLTLRNAGHGAWPAGDTVITYQWLAWDGRPASAAGAIPLERAVAPGKPATVRAVLPLPLGAGPFRCAFGLAVRGQAAVLEMSPLEPVRPLAAIVVRPSAFVHLDLSAAQTPRDWAALAEQAAPRGGPDGRGNFFPLEEFLPDATRSPAGFLAGYALGADPGRDLRDAPLLFAPARDGRAPMVRAQGQQIALPPRQAAALTLAALTVGKDEPCTLVVRYTEGEAQTIALPVSHWLGAPRYGEQMLLRTRFLRTARGDDWSQRGAVFVYRIPLDPTRTLAGLTLPQQPEVCLFAATLEVVAP